MATPTDPLNPRNYWSDPMSIIDEGPKLHMPLPGGHRDAYTNMVSATMGANAPPPDYAEKAKATASGVRSTCASNNCWIVVSDE